jgi:outer membrane protein assembly factor BamB
LVSPPTPLVRTVTSTRPLKTLIVVIAATVALIASAAPASAALPGPSADDTWMVNARVRALASAGGSTWVGGKFTQLQDTKGKAAGSASFLVALGANGAPAPLPMPALTGTTGAEIWDMNLAPDGVLYVGGKFNYVFGGKSYRNVVGLNPANGAIVRTFKAPVAKSVYGDGDRVYVGGTKVWAFTEGGAALPGFSVINVLVDDSLRGHPTPEMVRDIDSAGGWMIATGSFDFVNGDPQKVFFRFNPLTGQHDTSWAPSNVGQGGQAWGHEVMVVGGVLYSAAGGSDYTAAYNLGNGQLIWSTDTSGSSQSISLWDDDTLIVGGHFEYVEDADTPQCGSNQSPNQGCWHQPRLVALDRATGQAIRTWTPAPCCQYNGVWATLVEGNRLHIGGEFNKVGGVLQRFYGRFSGGVQ